MDSTIEDAGSEGHKDKTDSDDRLEIDDESMIADFQCSMTELCDRDF